MLDCCYSVSSTSALEGSFSPMILIATFTMVGSFTAKLDCTRRQAASPDRTSTSHVLCIFIPLLRTPAGKGRKLRLRQSDGWLRPCLLHEPLHLRRGAVLPKLCIANISLPEVDHIGLPIVLAAFKLQDAALPVAHALLGEFCDVLA